MLVPMTTTRRRLAVRAVAASVLLSGCTAGDDPPEQSPEVVLAAAKSALDKTTGVHITLSADELPPGVSGILSATGVGTHAPAFEGDLRVAMSGVTADVEVIAAEGRVWAKLPFTSEFVELDPSDYSAPDPARLMAPEGGLSSLLTAAEDVQEGERVRSGEEVLDSYTGTVPGEAVVAVVPGVSAGSQFDARFTVDDEDRLREAVLTGPFYPEVEEHVTYTIAFDEYGTEADITLQ
jgi:lipoprotein LprG